MNDSNIVFKLIRLVELLKSECPGTAQELADKLSVSRRTLFSYLDILRMHGAEIEYSRKRRTYVLKNEFDFFEEILQSAC